MKYDLLSAKFVKNQAGFGFIHFLLTTLIVSILSLYLFQGLAESMDQSAMVNAQIAQQIKYFSSM